MASAAVQHYATENELNEQQEIEERSSSHSPSPSEESSGDEQLSCSSDEQQPPKVLMLDPSEHFRPEEVHNGKATEEFRKYSTADEDYIQQRVKRTYHEMHKHQTVEFVRQRRAKWLKFNHSQLTIMEALVLLNSLIDESDPDCDLPNIVHAFQTAERIRAEHPESDWLQLTGLIHDLGKVMAIWGEQQWAVVGDTFLVGCAPADSIVYRETSFLENPDLEDPRYNSKYGIYEPNCGLDKVLFSWGHDEYLSQVLENHAACSLPKEAISMIKLHSFYPWHTGGDYMHLCSPEDLKTLPLIREFNKYDLYTKSAPVPDMDALIPYYQGLIDKYIPGKVKW